MILISLRFQLQFLKQIKNGSGIVKQKIAEDIANEIEEDCKDKDEVSISDIESMVYDKLITKKQRLTAKEQREEKPVSFREKT